VRTTIDLIHELETEAHRFTNAALAVGFEKTTTFVFADDAKRQGKLDEAVRVGGEPAGVLAFYDADADEKECEPNHFQLIEELVDTPEKLGWSPAKDLHSQLILLRVGMRIEETPHPT
jgi:hypothetical protein